MGQFLNYFKWLIYSNTFAHLCNRILLIHSRKIKLYIENTNIHVHTCTNDVTSVIIHIQNISTIKFSTVFKCQYTCGNICNQNTILLNLNIADNLYINCFVIEGKTASLRSFVDTCIYGPAFNYFKISTWPVYLSAVQMCLKCVQHNDKCGQNVHLTSHWTKYQVTVGLSYLNIGGILITEW